MKIIVAKSDGSSENNIADIFIKPDSCLMRGNKPFYIPDFSDHFSMSVCLAIRLCRLGKNIAERFAYRYYNGISVGLDLKAEITKANNLARNFDYSAIVGDFLDIAEDEKIEESTLNLSINGEEKVSLNTRGLDKLIDKAIERVSQYCTIKIGDIVFLDFSDTELELEIGQKITGEIDNNKIIDFQIK